MICPSLRRAIPAPVPHRHSAIAWCVVVGVGPSKDLFDRNGWFFASLPPRNVDLRRKGRTLSSRHKRIPQLMTRQPLFFPSLNRATVQEPRGTRRTRNTIPCNSLLIRPLRLRAFARNPLEFGPVWPPGSRSGVVLAIRSHAKTQRRKGARRKIGPNLVAFVTFVVSNPQASRLKPQRPTDASVPFLDRLEGMVGRTLTRQKGGRPSNFLELPKSVMPPTIPRDGLAGSCRRALPSAANHNCQPTRA